MSDVPELDAAGLPEELSAFDQILHRGEANPRTRSGIMTLELLDTTPDWERFRTRFENASRKVLRLRQKVVMPTLPTAAPRWVDRPRLQPRLPRAPGAGPRARHPARGDRPRRGRRCSRRSTSPGRCGRRRSSRDSRAAGPRMMVHLSHAVTDGVGGVEMFANIYDLERDPPPQSRRRRCRFRRTCRPTT